MGLIKAAAGALGGTFADQWKEFFTCDSLENDVLMIKGKKSVSGRSSNTKASDNTISNGSGVVVSNGQCMIIVEQGRIVELCAEPGEYTYNTAIEPSIFTGSFGEGLKNIFHTTANRFTYGGEPARDQRVYYLNTKEILDNKFGTPNPVLFHIVDKKLMLDMETTIRCSGIYSFRISDPLKFYGRIAGNVSDRYEKSQIEGQLKAEFIDALQPAMAKIAAMEIRPSAIPGHTRELTDAMNEALAQRWNQRGLEVCSILMNPVSMPEEDMQALQEMQREAQKASYFSDPTKLGAHIGTAQAQALKNAASNPNGAMMGFMGMGMAGNAGGGMMNAMDLMNMGAQQTAAQQTAAPTADGWTCSCGTVNQGKFCMNCGEPKPAPKNEWKCSCGTVNTGKFCMNCGAKKPEQNADGWVCSCGAVNQGRFCSECGAKKPANEPLYRCDKCGWKPEDPKNPPKFCPECGDPFDSNDIV